MESEILYMLGIVLAGFALNFGLRAVPFIIFGSRRGELPAWVSRFGEFVSPVIIAALIVYSYSGMQWKTAWPYLAGVLTVGLQVWKRNPLASIVAGTVLYMCLINCGCSSTRIVALDSKNPSIRVTEHGFFCGEDAVMPNEIVEILEDNDIPKTRTIHIRLEPDVKDIGPAKFLMATLAHEGYTRPVLVTPRHGESFSTGKRPQKRTYGGKSGTPQPTRKIRYKKANE